MNRTSGRVQKISCCKDTKASRGSGKVTKKLIVLDDKDLSHILWWKEVCCFSFLPHELSYSFDHIPQNLLRKPCFLFLGSFPNYAEVADMQKALNSKSN